MAGITLTQANEQLDIWLEASKAVAQGKIVSIDGESLTREDSDRILKMIDFWDRKVKQLSSVGGPVMTHGVYMR